VIYDATANKTRHQYLGKDTYYNVFVAEMMALQLAMETLRDNHEPADWRMYTDSQSAIKAVDNLVGNLGKQPLRTSSTVSTTSSKNTHISAS